MKTPLVLLFLAAAAASIEARYIDGSECRIWIDYQQGDLKEPQPLILQNDKQPTFVLPNKNMELIIPRNQTIKFACPGKFNGLQNFNGKPSINAVCAGGKKFIVEKTSYGIAEFTCKKLPGELIKKLRTPCLGKYQTYEIGYNLSSYFLPMLEICRDEKTLRTLYSRAKLVKELAGFQSKFPRPFWKTGFYYPGYNMRNLYTANSQIITLEHLLGSKELAKKYIRSDDQQYLNRGHLTAKADFVFGAHQMVTFWLLNTAPQWASFNAGNWVNVESSVRNYSITRKIDLDVYTGVHGVTTLIDINGNDQPLFLHANKTHSAFPVPRYFWKIVHDPISKRGLAIVGLNEPYASKVTKDMYLCPDITGIKDVEWVHAEFSNIEKGITYVCEVESLRQAIPTIPKFEVSGLLA